MNTEQVVTSGATYFDQTKLFQFIHFEGSNLYPMAAQQNNLWKECRDGKLEEVRAALQAGADPNTRGGSYNRTCLMEAIDNDHDEVVDLLLAQAGIEVNAKDCDKNTALHLACFEDRFQYNLSKLLAVPGILVNERNSKGRTPIMEAIWNDNIDDVWLMAAEAKVDLDVGPPISPHYHPLGDPYGESLEDYAGW